MENDPNKKEESKGKRIFKKATRRNSKSNNGSQNSALDQGVNVSRSKSAENKHLSVEMNDSTPLPTPDGIKEKIDNGGGNAQKNKFEDRTQHGRSSLAGNNPFDKTRLHKVDEAKNETSDVATSSKKKEVKLNSPKIAINERISEVEKRKKNLKRVRSPFVTFKDQ